MASEPDDSATMPQMMEILAGQFPEMPTGVMEDLLVSFDRGLSFLGDDQRPWAAALLREAAARSSDEPKQRRLLKAADCVVAGEPCALTSAGLTAGEVAAAELVPPTLPHLSVWNLFPGLQIRVVQTFRDIDGQEIAVDQRLRLIDKNYFFYDEGFTLRFEGRTIRIENSGPPGSLIIANEGNAYFEPLADRQSLAACAGLVAEQWGWLKPQEAQDAAGIRDEIDRCIKWLDDAGGAGVAPRCVTAGNAAERFPNNREATTRDLALRIAFLFAGVQLSG
jgi:hypothetical protein